MRIHVHARVWNEEKILPYFLRHYETFCEKIFIYDAYSTDKTEEIAKLNKKVEYIKVENEFGPDVLSQADLIKTKNSEWKKYSTVDNCDYVIVCDADEFIYHPEIINILEKYKNEGITVPKIEGYQMLAENFPTTTGQIYDEIKEGSKAKLYNKSAVLSPDIFPDFGVGCHSSYPTGNVKRSTDSELKLLHYKMIEGKIKYIDFIRRRDIRKIEIVEMGYVDTGVGAFLHWGKIMSKKERVIQ